MRNALLLCLLLLLLPAVATAKEATGRIEYGGWHCAACAGRVERAAKKVKGVTKVRATKDLVTVTYDDAKTDLDAIGAALAKDVAPLTFVPLVATTST